MWDFADLGNPDYWSGSSYSYPSTNTDLFSAPDTNMWGGSTLNLGDSSSWNTGGGSGGGFNLGNILNGLGSSSLPSILNPTTAGGLTSLAGILGTLLDNKSKPTQTTYLYPTNVNNLSNAVSGQATNLLNKGVTPYGGTLQVGRPWEYQASDQTNQGAIDMTNAGTLSVPQGFDLGAYMNPYVKGAIDPVANILNQNFAQQKLQNDALSAAHGAFGAERNTLSNDLLAQRNDKAISDLYGTGYANAYQSALGAFQNDMARKLQGANTLGGIAQNQAGNATALTNLDQFNALMPYQEFLRQQREPYSQLGAATSTLGTLTQQRPIETVTPPAASIPQGILSSLALGYGINQAGG